MKERLHRIFAGIIRLQNKPTARLAILVFLAIIISVFTFVTPTLAGDPQPPTSIGPIDRLCLLIAGLALYIAQAIGTIVVQLMAVIIIPLMQYNNFATSPVVGAGWAIIRDTVNMFFVIVLIIIAMGTIFGQNKFNWQRQVPKLMIFAIIINFSRLLCGLMIDIAQVIMLTFAYALKDIAGGNFVQLFGMASVLEVDPNAGPIRAAWDGTSTEGIKPFDLIAAAIAANFMMITIFVCLLFLAIILAYRIVMLWVLVTLAPLAWFFGGVGELAKTSAYASWWKNFTCYTAIGPVITFFLWLTLAVLGAGSIAAAEFEMPKEPGSVGGNILKSMDTSSLTSFIIGIAMLFAGFQAAQEICQGAQGAISGLTTGMAKYGAGAAALPLTIPRGAARLGARGVRGAARLGMRGAGMGWGAGKYILGAAAGVAGRELYAAAAPKARELGARGLEAAGGARFMPGFMGGYLKDKAAEQREKRGKEIAETAKGRPKIRDAGRAFDRLGDRSLLPTGKAQDLGTREQMLKDPKLLSQMIGKFGLSAVKERVTDDDFKQLEETMDPEEFKKVKKNFALRGKSPEDEDDLRDAAAYNWAVPGFRDSAKSIQVTVDIGGGKTAEMSFGQALDENRLPKDLLNKYNGGLRQEAEWEADREKDSRKPTTDQDVQRMPVGDFTPDVAKRFIRDGTEGQSAMIAKQGGKQQVVAANSDDILGAIHAEKSEQTRIRSRMNLAAASGGKQGDLLQAFHIEGNGNFAKGPLGDVARQDFIAAARQNPGLISRLPLSDPKSDIARASATVMTEAGMRRKAEELKDATDPGDKMRLTVEFNELKAAIDNLTDELAAKPTAGMSSEDVADLERLMKLQDIGNSATDDLAAVSPDNERSVHAAQAERSYNPEPVATGEAAKPAPAPVRAEALPLQDAERLPVEFPKDLEVTAKLDPADIAKLNAISSSLAPVAQAIKALNEQIGQKIAKIDDKRNPPTPEELKTLVQEIRYLRNQAVTQTDYLNAIKSRTKRT